MQKRIGLLDHGMPGAARGRPKLYDQTKPKETKTMTITKIKCPGYSWISILSSKNQNNGLCFDAHGFCVCINGKCVLFNLRNGWLQFYQSITTPAYYKMVKICR